MSLEFNKVLVLSTAHVTKETGEALNAPDAAGIDVPMHAIYEYGWLVWCDTDNGWSTEVYPDLKRVIDFARVYGCEWVRFDRDKDPIKELPKWQW